MRPESAPTAAGADRPGSPLVLALLSLIVGAAVGLVAAVFRLSLDQADRLRDALISWADGGRLAGFLRERTLRS
jgi:CIC family chloride channel protein